MARPRLDPRAVAQAIATGSSEPLEDHQDAKDAWGLGRADALARVCDQLKAVGMPIPFDCRVPAEPETRDRRTPVI